MSEKNEKVIHLVGYCGGGAEDYYSVLIFATTNEDTAIKYTKKFNRILKKWRKHYSKYEQNELGFRWIRDEYVEKYYNRWYCLRDIERAYYNTIKLR